MMHRLKAGLATAVLSALLSVGCSHPISDETLANSIKANLYSNATTKPENIAVAVKDGVVTLSGDVASADSALEAMKIANGTAGVRSVADQMTINGTSAAAQLPNAGSTEPAPASNPAPNQTSTAAAPAAGSTAAPASAQNTPAATTPVPAPVAQTPPPPREPVSITIPAGEQVTVRTDSTIDSGVNQAGQTFTGTLTSPLVTDGHVIIPVGTPATLVLTGAKSAGKIKGSAELEVKLSSIRYRKRDYPVDSSVVTQQGGSRTKQTAVRTGIGAAAGAVIGAIAGGGKGAAIGSAAGGGAGFGSDFFTHGPRVKIPAESVLSFRLESDLTVQR